MFRPATMEDVEFLASASLQANLERLSTRPDWDAAKFFEGFKAATVEEVEGREPNSTTYVIEADGKRVGRLRVVRTRRETHIAGIQILPGDQSKGTGTNVFRILKQESEDAGVPLTLEVEKDNPRAKRLWIRLGFEVAEDRGLREFMVLRDGA